MKPKKKAKKKVETVRSLKKQLKEESLMCGNLHIKIKELREEHIRLGGLNVGLRADVENLKMEGDGLNAQLSGYKKRQRDAFTSATTYTRIKGYMKNPEHQESQRSKLTMTATEVAEKVKIPEDVLFSILIMEILRRPHALGTPATCNDISRFQ